MPKSFHGVSYGPDGPINPFCSIDVHEIENLENVIKPQLLDGMRLAIRGSRISEDDLKIDYYTNSLIVGILSWAKDLVSSDSLIESLAYSFGHAIVAAYEKTECWPNGLGIADYSEHCKSAFAEERMFSISSYVEPAFFMISEFPTVKEDGSATEYDLVNLRYNYFPDYDTYSFKSAQIELCQQVGPGQIPAIDNSSTKQEFCTLPLGSPNGKNYKQ